MAETEKQQLYLLLFSHILSKCACQTALLHDRGMAAFFQALETKTTHLTQKQTSDLVLHLIFTILFVD